MSRTVELTMLYRPGCHLCSEAREVVEEVRQSVAGKIETSFKEVDIHSDPDLLLLHSEYVPVLLINGKRHATLQVDSDRLTAAIEKVAKPRLFSR